MGGKQRNLTPTEAIVKTLCRKLYRGLYRGALQGFLGGMLGVFFTLAHISPSFAFQCPLYFPFLG